MSNVGDKGRADYSKFDKFDIDVLEAILRADFDAPEAERMDIEAVIYISNLLAERREEQTPDVAEAKAEFYKYYYPLDKSVYDFGDDDEFDDFEPQTENIKDKSQTVNIVPLYKKIWRKFASVAAVLIIFLFGGTVTAYAVGYDPFAAIARWNDEHFWFEKTINVNEVNNVLSDYGDIENLVPKWLPKGYEFEDVKIVPYPDGQIICSSFVKHQNDIDKHICINYRQGVANIEVHYEKTSEEAIRYEKGGIDHYIIKNTDNITVIWLNNDFECSLIGQISVDEAKKIISSLY